MSEKSLNYGERKGRMKRGGGGGGLKVNYRI